MKNYYHKKAPLQLIDKEHKRRQRKPKSFSTAFTHPFNPFKPTPAHFIPSENTTKPLVFWCFKFYEDIKWGPRIEIG